MQAEDGEGCVSHDTASLHPPQHACLTRLTLTLSKQGGSPRWCMALAQLRTLRCLTITARTLRCLPVTDLTVALRRLPVLHDLRIATCRTGAGGAVDAHMLQLLDGISVMTQLRALALDWLDCGATKTQDWVAENAVAASLMALQQLTSLALTVEGLSLEWARVFGFAILRIPLLQELHIGTHGRPAAHMANATLLQLLCGSTPLRLQHPLRRLSFTDLRLGLRTFDGATPAARLSRSIAASTAARLTALHVRDSQLGAPSSDAGEPGRDLAGMLACMPRLQSLDLSGNELTDPCLAHIAAALPGLPALTHLAIGSTAASDVAIFAVLAALLDRPAPRRDAVAHIDISDSHICSRAAAKQLAGLLQQFRGLVVADLRSLRLGSGALEIIVDALRVLPLLREVHAEGNCVPEDGRVVATGAPSPLAALAHLEVLTCGAHRRQPSPLTDPLSLAGAGNVHCCAPPCVCSECAGGGGCIGVF